jgi:dihydrofolate reductase
MAKLIYMALSSLDGYIEDETGRFDWAVPDEEVHRFINDLVRPAGTYLYGRRLYETMAGWETDESLADHSPIMRDFAGIWQSADKVVYSTTLATPSTSRTRIEKTFDADAVRYLKATTERDILIGGPGLAAPAFEAGLVDECRLFLVPVLVGDGKGALPGHVRLELELLEERRFGNGTVYLRYRTK